MHVKETLFTFNYAYSSRSDEPIHYHLRANDLKLEPGYWRYYRRSSSEPTTSLDSFNGFADDEAENDDDEESLIGVVASPVSPLREPNFLWLCLIAFSILLLGTGLVLYSMLGSYSFTPIYSFVLPEP